MFKLPLRQTQGFINSLFIAKGFTISCPDYSTLSKRLKKLNIECPKYLSTELSDENIETVAIDSTDLKGFGRDEWHQEKYNISAKHSWRKLHIVVDDEHYTRANILTDIFTNDDSVVEELIDQMPEEIDHFTLDGTYYKNPAYEKLTEHSTAADIVIPLAKNAVLSPNNLAQGNRNIMEIKQNDRME